MRQAEPADQASPHVLRRLSARSLILSALLGAHPPEARGSDIVAIAAVYGIQENATRVALTRLVNAGDLVRDNAVYRLSQRLIARQQRQDAGQFPAVRPWNGQWRIVVITSVGNDAATRAALRVSLGESRYGELREGVWMRPDNLDIAWPGDVANRIESFTADPDRESSALVRQLFDVDGWAQSGNNMLEMLSASTLSDRFGVFAAIVRHLTSDPCLPAELWPRDWPGDALRTAYNDFHSELTVLRDTIHARGSRSSR